ncbi:YadA family autotransporter adhesin [Aurantiacibacter rhizosphaerae]|nr:YadA-like family protein [Aurantiacibacter rhizosphaerae]
MQNTQTKIFRATMLASAAVAGTMAPALSRPAHAQALQPVVDVCTGISLDDSLLRDVLATTVVPTATGVERLYDELLDLELVIGIGTIDLLDIPDVDLGIAQTTAALAAGDPVSLQVLDTDGNIISPGDCNITSDGYTLNDAAGLAIGGNQITGLGDGLIASAAEVDAIALGNNASTSAGATGAVALGTDASATAANSVALGAGSIASRGAQTGYSAPLMTGTFDSVGSVSVGAPGALRQITNVAPGSEMTDAATVGQVQAAIDGVNGAIANAVQYDDATQADITLGGVGGTTIANLADGELSATSDEAVNGSQLFATNTQVDANTGAIGTLQTDVADNAADIAVNAGDIAQLQDTAVQYDDASQTSVTLGGAGGTTVTNVAAGALNAGSSDAVNGSQLFATNTQVDANTIAIQANSDAITAISVTGDPLGVAYDDATRTSVTFDGPDGTLLANVADGEVSATSDEAVNGSQLFATNQAVDDLDGRVTTNEGDIANIDARLIVAEGDILDLDARVTVNEGDIATNTTDIANLDNRVTINETDIANIDDRVTVNEGDIAGNTTAIANMDTRVTVNTTAITQVQEELANVPVGYVSDTDPSMQSDTPTSTAAFMGAGGGSVRVTNVAAGNVAAGSSDAVNGSQLAATNSAVAANRTDIDQNTADITTINNNLAGSTVVAIQYSDPANPTVSNGGTITQDVAFVGADGGLPVRVHNVANGTLANDAVNLGQLQSGLADAMAGSMAYTDQRFDTLSSGLDQLAFNLDELRDDAFSGTASAMALAGIPQTMGSGRTMLGGGVGHYRGRTAFAIGISTTFSDGDGVIKAGGTMDEDGHGGFSAGAGFSF